jgi:ferric-dicitrate binding protein FerR (iron transport regulator)
VFKGKSREVALNGEAYFDVISNPQKPFVVSGKNIRVVAYGTSFNVEAYPEDQMNKVTLVKGKVEVFGEKDNKTRSLGLLTPGEMCVFNSEQSSAEFVRVDASKITSWKDGKLVFINEPFSEVVKKLDRRYSVNIVIKDERLKDYSYLATFEDETLDEALNLLKLSAPIKIKEREREKKPDGSYGERTIEFYFKN